MDWLGAIMQYLIFFQAFQEVFMLFFLLPFSSINMVFIYHYNVHLNYQSQYLTIIYNQFIFIYNRLKYHLVNQLNPIIFQIQQNLHPYFLIKLKIFLIIQYN